MLEIELERALEPEMMRERPCGVCGADFQPKAVLANLVTECELAPTCEACLSHLARRAEEEPIPADWGKVYERYLAALREITSPVFPSVEAVMRAEARDPEGTAKLMRAAMSV